MPDGGNWKEMFGAAEDGDLDLLRYHLERGVDPNFAHPEYLATALVAAILKGQIAAAELLLEFGAQPHLPSEADGLNPAQAAWRGGHHELAQRLDPEGRWAPAPPRLGFWRRLFA
ncbi:ankyrin repeat protein [Inhella inkyongensis]|uniref:Ankyrin repeat protein n=1 Tax=Inhella inkyongensis TaxID=392593 RepID=A0A840S8T2_9BURK|nr:ankyrin repeat domain-containing protein [Inhella inkyongensis]MBB5206053.1 ankyrin repeat protein [Inhella inkyongensis]